MDPLCAALWDKIAEQIDHAGGLVARLPAGAADWSPKVPDGTRPLWPARTLAAHLVECTAGFLAVLCRLRPVELARLERYRGMPLPADAEGVRARLGEYRREIEAGLALLSPADLLRTVPTVFVPAGEPALTLLLGNLEHLVSHKQQLFLYLRLAGVAVATPDLYQLRGTNWQPRAG